MFSEQMASLLTLKSRNNIIIITLQITIITSTEHKKWINELCFYWKGHNKQMVGLPFEAL